MKVVLTKGALRDLDEILDFLVSSYPSSVGPFEDRMRAIFRRLERWPESGAGLPEAPPVRMAEFVRYPYRLFYRVKPDRIEILHIRHTSRRPWTGPTADED